MESGEVVSLDAFRPNGNVDGPVFTDLRDIQTRDVTWIDRPFLPRGELVTNNADGGTGKGLLAVHYAAMMTTGRLGGRCSNVVFVMAEDRIDTVLKPRLEAAGANLERIRCLSWQRKGFADGLKIPEDVPRLAAELSKISLIVIDPLLSHLSGKTNSHTDHEVKLALQPLLNLAHATGCTVLGNGHFGKDKTRGAASSAQGSNAFINTPRLALAMAHDDEESDLRVLEVVKSNVSLTGVARSYRVRLVMVDGLLEQVPLLEAEGASTKSVDELLLVPKGKRVPPELIREAILVELELGRQSRDDLNLVCARKTGATADAVYRSGLMALKRDGKVRCKKDGFGGDGTWWWSLT